MRALLPLAVFFAFAARMASAGDPVTQTTGYDNVHIRVSDPAKAVAWYVKTLGGTSPAAGQVYFGSALIAVVKTNQPQPSAGSAIDHIGLSYPDIAAKMKEAESAGARVLSPPREIPGVLKFAFIEDPWGVKIELVEDSELLGFHHVHLSVKDPAATLAWFQQMFGGERQKLKGRIDGLRYGGVWLFAAASQDQTPAPSFDRAIMSLGLRVPDIHKSTAELVQRGVKFPVEPRALGDLWYAFAEDPNGVRVELLQRPPQ
jgi:catechol 2,3-dioxygenase-like lactoylglutathione lyase family enzyme